MIGFDKDSLKMLKCSLIFLTSKTSCFPSFCMHEEDCCFIVVCKKVHR